MDREVVKMVNLKQFHVFLFCKTEYQSAASSCTPMSPLCRYIIKFQAGDCIFWYLFISFFHSQNVCVNL